METDRGTSIGWERGKNMQAAAASWETEWLCPSCHKRGEDVELRCDHLSYVCPACRSTYGDAELAREYRALFMGYWEQIGELQSELSIEREIRQGAEKQLMKIRRVAA